MVIDQRLQERLNERQEHLIRATYQVMSRRGAQRVTLQQIADAASVSKGLLLYHFDSKDELVLRTMQWVLSRTEERIRDAIGRVKAPPDQVLSMIDVIFSHPEANRRFYLTYLDLLEASVRKDSFGQLAATFVGIVNAMYEEVIADGVESGAFTVASVPEASATVRAIIDGLFVQWLGEEDWKGTHARYRATAKRAILGYLGTDDEFHDWTGAVAPWT